MIKQILVAMLFSVSIWANAEDPVFPLKYCVLDPSSIEGIWTITTPGEVEGYVDIKIDMESGLNFNVVEVRKYDEDMNLIAKGRGFLTTDKKAISAGMKHIVIDEFGTHVTDIENGFMIYIRNHCGGSLPESRTILTVDPLNSDSKIIKKNYELRRSEELQQDPEFGESYHENLEDC